ncbi:fimbrial protein [Pseudomonas sp. LFM046]|uniref:fimbrial protein n=1 Tax=Pseudomonas sp. LFM046 TaxID=1608357 RepID=UPI0011AF4697|nr:fimbrial protein [Pseudomonas sp. LFM046]
MNASHSPVASPPPERFGPNPHLQSHRHTPTYRHQIASRKVSPRLILAALALFCGAGQALAGDCTLASGKPTEQFLGAFPASVTLKAANIGQVMAEFTQPFGTSHSWECWVATFGMKAITSTLALDGTSENIFQTGIPGVGIRFRFNSTSSYWGINRYPPFSTRLLPGATVQIWSPSTVTVQFIRIAMEVGRGDITAFDINSEIYWGSNKPVKVTGTGLKTKIVNNIYYTSCYNPSPDPTVNMGRPAAAHIKRGEVTEHPFALSIRCDGLNPTTKPPVKIYFEGDSPSDGRLKLTGQAQPGVANGVGISLKDDKGTPLPFAKDRALSLTWQRSAVNAEFYRFSGKAKYIATGGNIKPGSANATMTYILEYN